MVGKGVKKAEVPFKHPVHTINTSEGRGAFFFSSQHTKFIKILGKWLFSTS